MKVSEETLDYICNLTAQHEHQRQNLLAELKKFSEVIETQRREIAALKLQIEKLQPEKRD